MSATDAGDLLTAGSAGTVPRAVRGADPREGGRRERGDGPLLIAGGIAGVASVIVYAASQALPPALGEHGQGLAVFGTAALFGPLGMVNSYALYRMLAWERQGSLNRLALLMSVVAFALVTAMLLVQGAAHEVFRATLPDAASAGDEEGLRLAFRLVRAVDFGLDLAWDVFMGASMLLTAPLMAGHSRLGWWFALPAGVLGILLIALNAATFPWPPSARGALDVGPAIALYAAVLSTYMARIGWQERRRESAAGGRTASR